MTNELTNLDTLPKIREFGGRDWYSTKTNRRNLPHWELSGSTYFITISVRLEVGKPFFNPLFAELMIATLYKGDKQSYDLEAFVVMPDHVHFIIKPLFGKKLSEIMRSFKGPTAYQFNKLLNRNGKFWQTESWDHLIRDGNSLRQKWEYIKENPVEAKLVKRAEDYKYSSFFTNSG